MCFEISHDGYSKNSIFTFLESDCLRFQNLLRDFDLLPNCMYLKKKKDVFFFSSLDLCLLYKL